jgi:hypothetical protein
MQQKRKAAHPQGWRGIAMIIHITAKTVMHASELITEGEGSEP